MRGKKNPVTPDQPGPALPPCKVCGEQGTGFHYGVTTCGACKSIVQWAWSHTPQHRKETGHGHGATHHNTERGLGHGATHNTERGLDMEPHTTTQKGDWTRTWRHTPQHRKGTGHGHGDTHHNTERGLDTDMEPHTTKQKGDWTRTRRHTPQHRKGTGHGHGATHHKTERGLDTDMETHTTTQKGDWTRTWRHTPQNRKGTGHGHGDTHHNTERGLDTDMETHTTKQKGDWTRTWRHTPQHRKGTGHGHGATHHKTERGLDTDMETQHNTERGLDTDTETHTTTQKGDWTRTWRHSTTQKGDWTRTWRHSTTQKGDWTRRELNLKRQRQIRSVYHKGFFRRSLVRAEPYLCIGKGSCHIGPEIKRRKSCPKCRHDKCLALGMSKEAIKTGRYSHEKKSHDMMERVTYQFHSNNRCYTNKHMNMSTCARSMEPVESENSKQNFYFGEVYFTLGEPLSTECVSDTHMGQSVKDISPSMRRVEAPKDSEAGVIDNCDKHIDINGKRIDIGGKHIDRNDNHFCHEEEESDLWFNSMSSGMEMSCSQSSCSSMNSSIVSPPHSHNLLTPSHKVFLSSGGYIHPNAASKQFNYPNGPATSTMMDKTNTYGGQRAHVHENVETVGEDKYDPFQHSELTSPENKINTLSLSTQLEHLRQETWENESFFDNIHTGTRENNETATVVRDSTTKTKQHYVQYKLGDESISPGTGENFLLRTTQSSTPRSFDDTHFDVGLESPDILLQMSPCGAEYHNSGLTNIDHTRHANNDCGSKIVNSSENLCQRNQHNQQPDVNSATDEHNRPPDANSAIEHCITEREDVSTSSQCARLRNLFANHNGFLSLWSPFSPSDQDKVPMYSPGVSVIPESRLSHSESEYRNKSLSWCEFTEAELDDVIASLKQSHRKYVGIDGNLLSKEQLEEKENSFLEMFKCAKSTTDQSPFIDKELYYEILENTGLDVDGRKSCIEIWTKILDESLQNTIRFFKSVPGFKDVCMEDKVVLSKASLDEYTTLSLFRGVNLEKDLIVYAESRLILPMDYLVKVLPNAEHILNGHIQCSKRLKELQLTFEEILILKAITIMSPDRELLKDFDKVYQIYWRLHCCLLLCLWRRLTAPLRHYSKIISVLTYMREISEDNRTSYQKLGSDIIKLTRHLDVPLFLEMYRNNKVYS
ncbi:hypothetical protein Btru_045021 [Bulinus truncatus]|nr:hypothetical protein Btru_045021 [Bulinus truncatus]